MRISIIGLGWLGERLAELLLAQKYQVNGSTTSKEKQSRLIDAGFDVSLLSFDPFPQGIDFQKIFDTDVLFINIPPRSRTFPKSFHPEQIEYVKQMAIQAGVGNIIYVSSTSVYPDLNQICNESYELTSANSGNPSLLQAEEVLSLDKEYNLTILRMGGLFGTDRTPGRYFSKKEQVIGDTPVNYIHREDASRLVIWIIQNKLWNETYNCVAPKHPLRKEVYEKNAKDFNFPPPLNYSEKKSESWKEISSEKIIQTGYRFIFSNPLDFDYDFN
jgi:nucleoside-diphosphate-sugar epimerase